MRTHRVHVPRADLPAAGETTVLAAGPSRHLARVLKVRAGAEIVLFDGEGGEYPARVEHVERDRVTVAVLGRRAGTAESPLHTCLALALTRGERMDYAIQKATELGVSEIVPLVAERSVVQLDGGRGRRRAEHWRQIAIGACEQSGRTRLPTMHEPVALESWLGLGPMPGTRLVLAVQDGVSWPSVAAPDGAVTLAVGPEGGFSAGEHDALLAAGFTALQLGPRVLRAETAAAAAVLCAQLAWGDLAGASR